MFETPEILLDLTKYRCLAGYVLALMALQNTAGHGLYKLVLNTVQDAKWIAARLKNQGYTVLTIEPRDGRALVQVRN